MNDDLGAALREGHRETYDRLVRLARGLLRDQYWAFTADIQAEPLDDQAHQVANAFWLELQRQPRMLVGIRGWAGVRTQLVRFLGAAAADTAVDAHAVKRHFDSKVRRLLAAPPFVVVSWRARALVGVDTNLAVAKPDEVAAAAVGLPSIPSQLETWNRLQRLPPVAREQDLLSFLSALLGALSRPVVDRDAMTAAWRHLQPPVPLPVQVPIDQVGETVPAAADEPWPPRAFAVELLARDFLATLPAELRTALLRRVAGHTRGRPIAALGELRTRFTDFVAERSLGNEERSELFDAIADALAINRQLDPS